MTVVEALSDILRLRAAAKVSKAAYDRSVDQQQAAFDRLVDVATNGPPCREVIVLPCQTLVSPNLRVIVTRRGPNQEGADLRTWGLLGRTCVSLCPSLS